MALRAQERFRGFGVDATVQAMIGGLPRHGSSIAVTEDDQGFDFQGIEPVDHPFFDDAGHMARARSSFRQLPPLRSLVLCVNPFQDSVILVGPLLCQQSRRAETPGFQPGGGPGSFLVDAGTAAFWRRLE